MNENTEPNTETSEPEIQTLAPTPNPTLAPTPNPTLARQNQLQQAIQQVNKQILDMQGQQKLVADMLRGLEIQAAELRGALREVMRPAPTED